MPSWEYKLISSGPLGFASMQLLEQHLSQLGKDEWEIINFTSKPDNPLVFHGLARRPVARDWFPPAATPAKPAVPMPPPEPEEDDGRDERSFADELPPSRPANAPEPADLGLGDFDDLEGSEEDLPTLFDALQPFLRKNSRGDKSVELDFLAKKFEQDARELQTAFEECGLKTPAEGKGEVVDHDGSLYWLERDQKGRLWINTRDKRFKTVAATPVAPEALGADSPAAESSRGAVEHPTHAERTAREPRPEREARPERPAPQQHPHAHQHGPGDRAPTTFLGQIRLMMRRNRRGHGWSGSFQYLTKALKLDDAQLLEKLGESGLRLGEDGGKPLHAEDGGFEYWLNKNQRGEIWINADERRDRHRSAPGGGGAPASGRAEPAAGEAAALADAESALSEESIPAAAQALVAEVDAAAQAALPAENILGAVRLLMQPKKRGEGVTITIDELAEKLEKSPDQVTASLGEAGLRLPDSPKGKPTFTEHGGELYWLNANARGQVWVNAKPVAAKKSRSKKGE